MISNTASPPSWTQPSPNCNLAESWNSNVSSWRMQPNFFYTPALPFHWARVALLPHKPLWVEGFGGHSQRNWTCGPHSRSLSLLQVHWLYQFTGRKDGFIPKAFFIPDWGQSHGLTDTYVLFFITQNYLWSCQESIPTLCLDKTEVSKESFPWQNVCLGSNSPMMKIPKTKGEAGLLPITGVELVGNRPHDIPWIGSRQYFD